MYHMRILGTEPSSVILNKVVWNFKSDTPNVPNHDIFQSEDKKANVKIITCTVRAVKMLH